MVLWWVESREDTGNISQYNLVFRVAGTARLLVAADQLPFGEAEIAQHGFARSGHIEDGRR